MRRKYVAFGEVMLRLKSKDHHRLFQSPDLEASFGGGEANVAVSLSILGEHAQFVTALPDNAIGEACERELRKYGVDCSAISKVKDGRLGIYFLETGANQRPSEVVYDRSFSAISEVRAGDFDFKSIFKDAYWFHVTGITAAISQGAADAVLESLKTAKSMGVIVSIDLNYRSKLWKYGKKPSEVMRQLLGYADVVIANEEDIQKSLGIEMDVDVDSGSLKREAYEKLCERVKVEFPNVSVVAVTLRESKSADCNAWSAVLSGRDGFYLSRRYEIEDIVDRVGGGDSFSAGLIYALSHYEDEGYCINFAVAASCLKHSIEGDFNLSTLSEIESLASGFGTGRVRR